MLFHSHLFIFVFLPVVLAGYYVLVRGRNPAQALTWLVAASLVFYGWWNPSYLLLLLASIGVNCTIGRQLAARPGKALLALGIIANLALIGYYKYANFFVDTLNSVTDGGHTLHTILLPLGISFFTFQQIAWLVDVYKAGDGQARYGLRDYALFISFFPQLIAGPIVHHREMMPQFARPRPSGAISENLSVGLTIFLIGLFKKVVLADSVAGFASPVFDATDAGIVPTLYEAWIAAFAYTLQLYFDFSGYSDMAIGLARLFGITLPANFESPYKAASIVDFWRRWHMTLSRFLRDYLYIPLGGNRRGRTRRYVNLLLTMLLGGLWHGAGWTFIAWGVLHGVCLSVNLAWRSVRAKHRTTVSDTKRHEMASRALTLLVVVVAWVLFRAESWHSAEIMLASMAGLNGIALPSALDGMLGQMPALVDTLGLSFGRLFGNELVAPLPAALWIGALALIALVCPNTQQLMHRHDPVLGVIRRSALPLALQWQPRIAWALVVTVLALSSLLSLGGVSEFLYFQF